MPFLRYALAVSVSALTLGLAACMPTLAPHGAVAGTGPAAAAALSALPPEDRPLMPASYRLQIAAAVLPQYLTDAAGPAEITQPIQGKGLIGSTASLKVRFPVTDEKARGIFLIRFGEGPRVRCLTVKVQRGLFADGRSFSIERPKHDYWGDCDGAFEPYPELDRLVDKVQACRASGEKPCEISLKVAETKSDEPKHAKPKR